MLRETQCSGQVDIPSYQLFPHHKCTSLSGWLGLFSSVLDLSCDNNGYCGAERNMICLTQVHALCLNFSISGRNNRALSGLPQQRDYSPLSLCGGTLAAVSWCVYCVPATTCSAYLKLLLRATIFLSIFMEEKRKCHSNIQLSSV